MVKILGHRGIRQPENPDLPYQNTMEAFHYAIEKRADGFELDVITNKEGKCFIIHDDDISVHSNLSEGLISELTESEINQKSVGFNKHFKIPTLEQVLSEFKNSDLLINIEIKGKGIAENVNNVIRDTKFPQEKLVVSTFNHLDLHHMRDLNGDIKLGVLFGREAKENKHYENYAIHLAEKLGNSVFCMEKSLPFLDIFESKHEKYIWTIFKQDIDNFVVDGLLMYENLNLITDYPEELRKKLNETA